MQNNWKNSIKNAFKYREIEPQRDLWSELEKQLDQNEVKPLKKKRLLYFVAACITLYRFRNVCFSLFWSNKCF